jgi:molecular chaperone GrpE
MSHPGEETKTEDLNATGEEEPLSEHREIIEEIVEETIDNSDVETEQDSESELSVDEQLAAALDKLTESKDAVLRAEAEMQNVRRRAERDVENAHKYGIERFLQNLLPVVDSIEKSIESIESTDQADRDENDPVIEGIRLCYKLLLDVLDREQVEVVDPLGEPFDPNEHEAMSMVENPDMEPNSVFAVMQKGYKLNKRLVRPAMVMVSKAPT